MSQYVEILLPTQAVAATINSAAISAQNLFNISAQAVATGGSVAGAIKMQASNDISNGASNWVPTHWNDVTSATIAVSGAGSFLMPKIDICYEYVRFVYTDSGTGGTIALNIKVLGY